MWIQVLLATRQATQALDLGPIPGAVGSGREGGGSWKVHVFASRAWVRGGRRGMSGWKGGIMLLLAAVSGGLSDSIG